MIGVLKTAGGSLHFEHSAHVTDAVGVFLKENNGSSYESISQE